VIYTGVFGEELQNPAHTKSNKETVQTEYDPGVHSEEELFNERSSLDVLFFNLYYSTDDGPGNMIIDAVFVYSNKPRHDFGRDGDSVAFYPQNLSGGPKTRAAQGVITSISNGRG